MTPDPRWLFVADEEHPVSGADLDNAVAELLLALAEQHQAGDSSRGQERGAAG
jgi:hypothetical protein